MMNTKRERGVIRERATLEFDIRGVHYVVYREPTVRDLIEAAKYDDDELRKLYIFVRLFKEPMLTINDALNFGYTEWYEIKEAFTKALKETEKENESKKGP